MIECICNDIRTRHVDKALASPPEKTTPGQIYKAAAQIAGSPSCKMQCGKCKCRFDEIAAGHNASKGVAKIIRQLDETTAPTQFHPAA